MLFSVLPKVKEEFFKIKNRYINHLEFVEIVNMLITKVVKTLEISDLDSIEKYLLVVGSL